jgi:hypothetical protein
LKKLKKKDGASRREGEKGVKNKNLVEGEIY